MAKKDKQNTVTEDWALYENGKKYKENIGLYNAVRTNYRIMEGNHWQGIDSRGLPTPVLNIAEKVVNTKVAYLCSSPTSINFVHEGKDLANENSVIHEKARVYAEYLKQHCRNTWERLNMDFINVEGAKDCAVTGDFILYTEWDADVRTGQTITTQDGKTVEILGDINVQQIDNVNYYPANPNNPNVQAQDWIELTFRDTVERLKQEAKKYGVSKDDIEKITSDDEYNEQAGDMSQTEQDGTEKAICILKLWRNPEDGIIYGRKSVKDTIIRPEWSLNIKRYPVSMWNWKSRKNSCHGVTEISSIKANQMFINKQLSIMMAHAMKAAFPILVYDGNRLRNFPDKIGAQIKSNGAVGDDVARYITVGQMSIDANAMLNTIIDRTTDVMGVNDIMLGNVRPDNTSAFIAAREAALTPMQLTLNKFYQYIEDTARIWLEYWLNYYNEQRLFTTRTDDGAIDYEEVDYEILRNQLFNVRVEVGASKIYSEITTKDTMEKLLASGNINLKQFIERIPEGFIPDKDKLLAEVVEAMNKALEPAQDMPLDIPMDIPQGNEPQPFKEKLPTPQTLDYASLDGGTGTLNR